jgi:isopenicillin N synthase-like dioxygenase
VAISEAGVHLFKQYFANEAHANLRFLHYPPQDTLEHNTFGQAPHTDNSFMTALARTEVPGLAVRLASVQLVRSSDRSRDLSDQSRQHHAALV